MKHEEIAALLERLLVYRSCNEWGDNIHHTICGEAATAIRQLMAENEALQARNSRLRIGMWNALITGGASQDDALAKIRAALGEQP